MGVPVRYESVAALELLDRTGGGRGPVADALRLVENDQVGAEPLNLLQVLQDQLVVDQVEEGRAGVEFLAPRFEAVDDLGGEVAESFNLGLPLVLDRSRRDDNDSLDASAAAEQLGGRDGLDGLAQAHVVGQRHASAAGGEQRSAHLVREQRRFDQIVEGKLSRLELAELLAFQHKALLELVDAVHVFEHVAVNHRRVVAAANLPQEFRELPVALSR